MGVIQRATEAEKASLLRALNMASEPSKRKRPAKYKNKVVHTADGRFDSQGECNHWEFLKIREKAGEITLLTRQKIYELRAYPLHADDGPVKIGSYKADFDYFEGTKHITADFKGMVTQEFKRTAKIFKANYGRDILVVTK